MMDLLLLVSGCELWRPPLEVGESSFVVAVGCSAAGSARALRLNSRPAREEAEKEGRGARRRGKRRREAAESGLIRADCVLIAGTQTHNDVISLRAQSESSSSLLSSALCGSAQFGLAKPQQLAGPRWHCVCAMAVA